MKKIHREHFGATEMAPMPVDGQKITENIWARPDRRCSMVMKNHREHFGATEMAPTGSSPVDGHEKITENIWARPDRRCSMVMKKIHREHFGATEMALTGPSPVDGHEKSQRTFGRDRIVAARWS